MNDKLHFSYENVSPETEEWTRKLFDAARRGSIDDIDEALAHGADIRAQYTDNRSGVLHRAMSFRQINAFKHLLSVGADPNITTIRGYGPLYQLCKEMDKELVPLVLDYGANPNQYDVSGTGRLGDTILHDMVAKGDYFVVKALLEAGADPLLKNGNDKIAYDLVVSKEGFSTLAPLLLSTLESHQAMPRIPEEGALSHDILFERNERGFCPLDNPVTWRKWPEVVERLKAAGERLPTKAELLREGKHGEPYLLKAAKARSLDKAVATLNEQGETLGIREWLENRELRDYPPSVHIARALLSPDNLRYKGTDFLRAEYNALPEKVQQSITNYNTLLLEAATPGRSIGRGR